MPHVQAASSAPGGFSFPRRARLTRGAEIQTVIREGKRIRTVHLDVRVLASPLASSAGSSPPGPRVGIVVPRHHQTAVDRNRLKRRLRELVRVELLPELRAVELTADIAIRARREAYRAQLDGLRTDVLTIRSRLRDNATRDRTSSADSAPSNLSGTDADPAA